MDGSREQTEKRKGWFILPAYIGSLPDKADVPACPECRSTKFVAAMIDEQDGTTACVSCENGHAWRPNELIKIHITEATRAEEHTSRAAGHALDVWLNQFWTEIEGSTDRALAILSGAMLDEVLGILLSALAINKKLLEEHLLNPNRPLGGFGPKIDACYLFGLISEREWRSLHHIQKIRNAFAHKLVNLSFKDTSMIDNARAIIDLLQLKEPIEDDGRKIFLAGVSALWTALIGKITLVIRAAKMPFDPSSAMTMHYVSGKFSDRKS